MGNFEAKYLPYYAIADENSPAVTKQTNGDKRRGSTLKGSHVLGKTSLAIWAVKRANYNNSECKNATLFEFECESFSVSEGNKKTPTRELTFALNQIKVRRV